MPPTKTIEVYADTKGFAPCRDKDCGQRLMWAQVVKSGAKMCFTGEPVALTTRHEEGTHRLIEAYDFADNHWATCIGSAKFKKK